APVVPGGEYVNVHSKVLVVDDQFVKIGSANMSNRSVGLDTECDLAIEGPDVRHPEHARVRDALAGLGTRPRAEHLGPAVRTLAEAERATGGVAAALAALRGGPRTLAPLDEADQPVLNLAMLDGLMCDPERPFEPEALVDKIVPDEHREPVF